MRFQWRLKKYFMVRSSKRFILTLLEPANDEQDQENLDETQANCIRTKGYSKMDISIVVVSRLHFLVMNNVLINSIYKL